MKKIIRALLNKFGYDFAKVNTFGATKSGKIFEVKVGNYSISIPGNNEQISLYKYSPDANSQMARLAELIFNKYQNSSMIDIGANVGDTIAVVRSKTNIPIIAIEGDDFSFSFLKKNVTQFKDVYILNQFLGEEKNEIKATVEKEGWNNTIIPSSDGTKLIAFKTLDEVIVESNLQPQEIKLLKIDTEGFDTIILRGCNKTIQKSKPVIYFEYNGDNMKAIEENGLNTILNLKNFGYNQIQIFDCINNLIIATTLSDTNTLTQIHKYVFTKNTMIPYYDICIFHENDNDLADYFIQMENQKNK